MASPRILITSGEPAGIGPDLCVMLAETPLAEHCVVLANRATLQQRAQQLGSNVALISEHDTALPRRRSLRVRHLASTAEVIPGKLDARNASHVIEMLKIATHQCLDGSYDAVVTCPVHKGIINDAGIRFSGHTEFFADLCGKVNVVMMLTAKNLRVALVTTHLPLAEISRHITAARLEQTITTIQRDFTSRLGIENPRILVCGLNPHAGESGHLGREELDIITPVIQQRQQNAERVSGPYPADTIFLDKYLKQADVILAMYHDQGLPLLKYVGFGEAVNVTLGLPFVRTSVDHGTATDLAGTGTANPASLYEAIAAAIDMAGRTPP